MKRITISLILIYSLLIPTVSPANAADQCLAEFPESAWLNGEPQEVKNKLNYNLIGKQSFNVPQSMFSNLKYGDIDYVKSYEYSGSNCTTRQIKVSKKSTDIPPVFFSVVEFKNLVKKSSTNFEMEKTNLAIVDDLISILSSLKVDVNVDPISLSTFPEYKIRLDKNLSKLFGNMYLQSVRMYTPILQANGDCSFIPFESDPTGFQNIKAVPTMGTITKGVKFQSNSPCTISLLYASSSALGFNFREGEMVGFFKVGEFILNPIKTNSSSKKTITCIKGKLTKKVTGTSPKCPTGYKKT